MDAKRGGGHQERGNSQRSCKICKIEFRNEDIDFSLADSRMWLRREMGANRNEETYKYLPKSANRAQKRCCNRRKGKKDREMDRLVTLAILSGQQKREKADFSA